MCISCNGMLQVEQIECPTETFVYITTAKAVPCVLKAVAKCSCKLYIPVHSIHRLK